MLQRTMFCLLILVLSACSIGGIPTAAEASTVPSRSPEQPASVVPPTAITRAETEEPAPPTSEPTSEPSPEPSSEPAPEPTPAAEPELAPEVAIQSAALLPELASDLSQAGQWDRYTIIGALDPGRLTVSGTTTLVLTNRSTAPFAELYFHLYPNHPDFGGRLDITSATVNDLPVDSGAAYDDTLFRLDLAEPLAPGASATVVLGYSARTPRNASADTFGAYNYEAGLWSMANFYPVLAQYSEAGEWDTREIVARGDFTVTTVALYDVTIDVPADWVLLSTGVSITNEPVNEQIRRERFVSGPQREFYLGAFQGLEQASSVVDGTRIVTTYQPDNAAAGQRSLEIAEQSLRAFNARFGRYPLAELDIVQGAMTQFLGMEYPGIVLIEQNLYNSNGRDFETTVAHEIGHQWWYSQIGSDAQGEAWLDEGLASYAQVVYYESLGATANANAELDAFRRTYRQARDAGRDAPLGASLEQLGGGRYYPVIYAKAPLFFHALRQNIGEEHFSAFLQNYYAAHRYGDVVGADLLASAEQSCACDLQGLYTDWVTTAARVTIP